jgi:hypothetical protein
MIRSCQASLALVAALASGSFLLAASKSVDTSIAEGQKLVADLRSQAPTENLEVNGVLKICDGDGNRTRRPFRYHVVIGDGAWKSIYETQPSNSITTERLIVMRQDGRPNRYLLSRSTGAGGQMGEPESLSGDKAMVPFANSDFWLADLGLEFLHWPQQRMVKEAKIKMRKGRPCQVIESVNPQPGASGYTRVRSWIDTETGKPILAEAYGPDNKLMKEFEIGGLTKINGSWELKNMGMRSTKTDSLTVLEFKYERRE